jgi:hypothetical protein
MPNRNFKQEDSHMTIVAKHPVAMLLNTGQRSKRARKMDSQMSVEFKRRHFDAGILGFPATLIEREDARPIRPVTTGRQRKPVGAYYSLKLGRSVPWESRNELHAIYMAEVSTDVVSYRVQPHRVELFIRGIRHLYTPDREDTLPGGGKLIVEIKEDFKAARDPHYTEKLEYARVFYGALGLGFLILNRAEIEAQPRFKVLELIQSFRRTVVTTQDILVIHDLFRTREALPLSEVTRTFENEMLGFAKLSAMMVRRIVAIDLTQPLRPTSLVRRLGMGGAP